MAFWDKISSRGNVEDRRGMGPVFGGIGIGGVALMLLANVLLGTPVDVGSVLGTILELQTAPGITDGNNPYEGADEYEVFASAVLGSANDLWIREFASANREYVPPNLVLFRSATRSACGTATSDVGPHYCPPDGTIYLDETFFDELIRRFGATGGDVAEAYVIAHEVGHHIQSQLGLLEGGPSVQTELQADCLAGLWAYSVKDRGVLEPDEIREAMDAAAAVGDDRIQKRSTGYVNPETWTHGSSEDRIRAFTAGYESGNTDNCGL